MPWAGDGSLRQLSLIPFAESLRGGASAPLEMIFNVLIFVPFGAYLALLAPGWSWWRSTIAAAGASLALEAAQYLLAVGNSDVTDIVTNTIGSLIGLAAVGAARRGSGPRGAGIVARICRVGTAIALLACVAFSLSPLHYAQREAAPGLGGYATTVGKV